MAPIVLSRLELEPLAIWSKRRKLSHISDPKRDFCYLGYYSNCGSWSCFCSHAFSKLFDLGKYYKISDAEKSMFGPTSLFRIPIVQFSVVAHKYLF